MSEYYGVTTPTDDFLAHWGVKGMKWGIRKARPQVNGVRKSFGYRRAEKKLAKLEAKANRNALLEKANRLDKVSKGARKVGRVGLGAAAAGTGASVIASKVHLPAIKAAYKNGMGYGKGAGSTLAGSYAEATKELRRINQMRKTARGADLANLNHNKAYYEQMLAESKQNMTKYSKEMANKTQNVQKARGIARSVQAAGAGLAALGYGAAIGSKLRANTLRKTANNSAKMAAARQRAAEFRKQMNAKYGVQNLSKKRK